MFHLFFDFQLKISFKFLQVFTYYERKKCVSFIKIGSLENFLHVKNKPSGRSDQRLRNIGKIYCSLKTAHASAETGKVYSMFLYFSLQIDLQFAAESIKTSNFLIVLEDLEKPCS